MPVAPVPTAAPSMGSVFVTVVRRAAPRVVEASVVPTVLFYVTLVTVGMGAALAAAVAYTYGAIGVRVLRRRPVPPLLLLGAIGTTVKTVVAVATRSTFLYFAQPVATSVLTAALLLASVAAGRPLIARLASDFWPLPEGALDRPGVLRLFRDLTYVWAATNVLIGAATLALLVNTPLTTFLAAKQGLTLAITAGAIVVTIDRSLRTAHAEGLVGHADTGAGPASPVLALPPAPALIAA